jgi:hypothetical protein
MGAEITHVEVERFLSPQRPSGCSTKMRPLCQGRSFRTQGQWAGWPIPRSPVAKEHPEGRGIRAGRRAERPGASHDPARPSRYASSPCAVRDFDRMRENHRFAGRTDFTHPTGSALPAARGFSLSRGAAAAFPRKRERPSFRFSLRYARGVVVSSSASETPRWARTNGSAWRAESSGGQSRG